LIDGYSGTVDWPALSVLGARLLLALYLIASALAFYDRAALRWWEAGLRLLAAVLILWKTATVMWVGLIMAMLLIGLHAAFMRSGRAPISSPS